MLRELGTTFKLELVASSSYRRDFTFQQCRGCKPGDGASSLDYWTRLTDTSQIEIELRSCLASSRSTCHKGAETMMDYSLEPLLFRAMVRLQRW